MIRRSLSAARAVLFLLAAGTAHAQAFLPSPEAAALPDMPLPVSPVLRAALPATEPAFALPRSWHPHPAASRSDVPGKVGYYLRSTASLRVPLEAFAVAGVPDISAPPHLPQAPFGDDPVLAQQYQHAVDAYGDQIDAWRRLSEAELRTRGDRLGVGLGTAETRVFFSNLVLPLALHQQARYIPAPVHSDLSGRIGHALASVAVTRNDAGGAVPNYAKLGGTIAAAFIGKSIYAKAFHAPELDSTHFAARYIASSLAGDAATNTVHELLRAAREPDMSFYDLHGRAAEESYYPLSVGGKLVYWLRSTYAARNFASAVLLASRPVIPKEPAEPVQGDQSTYGGYPDYDSAYNHFGQALLGWKDGIENDARYRAKRLGAGFAESETQELLANLALPVLFDMDPRYVPLGAGHAAGARFGHAVEGLWVTHTDAGSRTVNLPVLGGTAGAALLAKEAYYPRLGLAGLQSTNVFAKTVSANLAADLIYNVLGEFVRRKGY